MDEIIKYHNDMNKVNFSGFNEKELNIFFSLILLAKDKGTNELSIPFSELRKLSNDDGKNRDRFIKSMVNTHSKLIQLFYKIETKSSITMFTLFNRFEINLNENILNVRINKDFAFLLNDLVANFTKFDLIEFTSLKSIYSKNIFKILKQWENKKEKDFSMVEFKKLLSIPKSYKLCDIDKNVLAPLRKDLPEFFPNLKIEKIKTGRAVTSLKFTWGHKHQDINYVDDVEIEISDELQKAFEKASHNRFIQPFLTEDNKAELIEFFEDEKILIKGLIYAYKKIDKEFKRLSYLIKTIKTGAEQQTKTIKIVKKEKENSLNEDDYRQTSFDEIIPQPKAEEKQREIKEIYEDEFEQLYKEYLTKNNIEDSRYVKQCFSMPYKIIKREPKKEEKKVYTIDDIPEEKLLSKTGKKLVGGALKMRVKKILDEMNK